MSDTRTYEMAEWLGRFLYIVEQVAAGRPVNREIADDLLARYEAADLFNQNAPGMTLGTEAVPVERVAAPEPAAGAATAIEGAA